MFRFISTLTLLFVLVPAQAQAVLPLNIVTLHRDVDGIVHIYANTERDLVYAQGWAHARDRFFQMDALRRQASGTLGELLGESVIGDDVLLRTLGLRRAAERSLTVLSAESLAVLGYYAEGVNAFVAQSGLPAEYAALEITAVPDWTPLDSVTIAKLLAFGLSFDLDTDLTSALVNYQAAGADQGFDGSALFFEDLYRSAPFDSASTVPDASVTPGRPTARNSWRDYDSSYLRPQAVADAQAFFDRLAQVPVIGEAIKLREGIIGSNEWGVAGSRTISGRPIMANDPHLSLDTPATFYQNRLFCAQAGYDVMGSSFTGVPLVVLGQNRNVTWGATTNPMDVTDAFQETLAAAPGSDFGLGTVTNGVVEPLELLVLQFRVNRPDDGVDNNLDVVGGLDIPPFALIVPRRNNGPIVSLDIGALSAVSLQYTGFGATREIDAFRLWNKAQDLDDFIEGLQYFDFGSQNWAYADIDGNLAYFTSGELPLREDLQAETVNGLPPFFIRNGTGGNEWLATNNPEPGQASPTAVLPFAEMPQVINPSSGWFVNANNDPIGNTLDNNPLNELRPGGGIFYMNPGYAPGMRAGRITQALTARLDGGKVSPEMLAQIQSSVRLLDAEVFTPYLLAAFQAAQAVDAQPDLAALASDIRTAEALARLANWDYEFPTGVMEGYDASDVNGVRSPPSQAEIDDSIAATLYSVWRGRVINNIIDAPLQTRGLQGPGSAQAMTALRNLLDNFAANDGVGASGIDFFAVPGIAEADDRRDFLLLSSMVNALDLLASNDFFEAFNGSTEQSDYRWGRLHRLVMDHPLGGTYNLPSAGGALEPSFADLAGFAVDGGYGAVDASSHSVRAANSSAFMFSSGPVRRYVGQPGTAPGSIVGRTILPGGSSGVLGSPWYANLTERWLTNESYPMRQNKGELKSAIVSFVALNTTPVSGGRAQTVRLPRVAAPR